MIFQFSPKNGPDLYRLRTRGGNQARMAKSDLPHWGKPVDLLRRPKRDEGEWCKVSIRPAPLELLALFAWHWSCGDALPLHYTGIVRELGIGAAVEDGRRYVIDHVAECREILDGQRPSEGLRCIEADRNGNRWFTWEVAVVSEDSESSSGVGGSLANETKGLVRYLDQVAVECSRLPGYFPKHLRVSDGLLSVCQSARVLVDPPGVERWNAEERERFRGKGWADLHNASPSQSGMEKRSRSEASAPPETIQWNDTRVPRSEGDQKRFLHTIVRGDPGFGKTWLLKHEAIRLATTARRVLTAGRVAGDDLEVPVFVRLPDLARAFSPEKTFEQSLMQCLERTRLLPRALTSLFLEMLEKEQLALLLDGWDEVGPASRGESRDLREVLAREIESFSRVYRGRIVITSRRATYAPELLPFGTEVEILPFDAEHIDAFVEHWFSDEASVRATLQGHLARHPKIRGLARVPLLLSLICRNFQERGAHVPLRRAALYRETLEGLLFDWREADKRASIPEVLRPADMRRLAKAAWSFRLCEQFEDVAFATALGFDCEHRDQAEEADRRIAELLELGVLVRVGRKMLTFLHLTFQEYLTALELSKRPDVLELVDRLSFDPAWHDVIVLSASCYARPTDIAEILSRECDDCPTAALYPRLALSGRLLSEDCDGESGEVAKLRRDVFARQWSIWQDACRCSVAGAYEHVRRSLNSLLRASPELADRLAEDLSAAVKLDLDSPVVAVVLAGSMSAENRGLPEHLAVFLKGLGRGAVDDIVDQLVELARDEDDDVRLSAVRALGNASEKTAERVLGMLLGLLRDQDSDVRLSAMEAILTLNVVPEPRVIVALIGQLEVEDGAEARATAIDVLGKFGSLAVDEIAGRLVKLLSDEDADVRSSAEEALMQASPKVVRGFLDDLVELMGSEVADVRSSVIRVLQKSGTTLVNEAIGPLVMLLRDVEPSVRADAVEALSEVSSRGIYEIVESLVTVLTDEDIAVRLAAADSLKAMGDDAVAHAVDILAKGVADGDVEVRARSALALGQLEPGPIGSQALGLTTALIDRDDNVRVNAAWALGRVGAGLGDPVVEPLARLLRDDDEEVRWAASDALVELRKETNASVINSVVDLLYHQEPYARALAARTIGEIRRPGCSKAIGRLIELLKDEHEGVRACAARALQEVGQHDIDRVVGPLTECLSDLAAGVRLSSALALVRLKRCSSDGVIAALRDFLNDDDLGLRSIAAMALRSCGPKAAQAAVLELVRLSAERGHVVSWAARSELRNCEVGSLDDTVKPLIKILRDGSAWDRIQAANILQDLGPAIDDTVACELAGLLGHKDAFVRGLAAECVRALGTRTAGMIVERVVKLLADPDSFVRVAAASAVGRLTINGVPPADMKVADRWPNWT